MKEQEKIDRQDLSREISEIKSRLRNRARRDAILQEAFSSNPDSITVADVRQGKILMVNDATESLTGYSMDEWLYADPDEFDIWVDKSVRDDFYHWLRNRGEDRFYESILRRKDGSEFVAQITGNLLRYEEELLSVTTIRDITDQREKERERKEYEARYRAIAEDTPLMICRFGAGGVLTYVNRAYCDYVNHTPEELTGTSFLLFLPPTDREVIIADIEALTPQSPTLSHEQSDIGLTGELRWQRWTTHALFTEGKATSYQSIGEDITEHKTIEEENDRLDRHIQRLNKLEIIGTLAGGIAHDFNNILSPILGYTDLALLRVAAPDPVHKHLTQISKAAYRAVDLVKQILLFGRQVDQEKQSVAVQQIIQEAMELLRPSIPKTVEIQLQIDSSCGKVYADATQIHQVIVNLCTNAWQAMEQAGGVLSIELKQVDLDYTQTAIYPGLTHTQLIRLTITDTGIGMDKLTLNQIFEPFFTTKPVDKGTGMGLSVVHGIVHSHDGIIVANSEPGKGAEFKVYLPVDQKTVEARKIVTEKMAKGDESILIVDDEEMLTDMMQEILTSHGYKVDAYNNSLEALDAYKRNPDNFDLIISDLTMPNLAGTELLKEVHKFSPGFPTILMTGYSGSSLDNLPAGQVVLPKPMTAQILVKAVSDALSHLKEISDSATT